jgi:hypothetical protein
MSWEAVTWANKQRLKSPQEQLVLLMLANCADPGGVAFAQWKGRDHWWHYLADRTRLSRASLFRHLNTIEQLGLGIRSTIVLSDGSKRPIIQLDFAAGYDVENDENQSHHETEDDVAQSQGENSNDMNHLQEGAAEGAAQSHGETEKEPLQSHSETGVDAAKSHHETKPVSLVRLHIDSNTIPIRSPPTPRAGGELAIDQDWEEFKKAWREPMQRPSLVQSVWDHIPSAKRGEAVTAARGYWTWIGKQPKPPSAVSAQTFLREASGWPQWLPWAGPPGSAPATPTIPAFLRESVEAKAIHSLYALARSSPLERGNRVLFSGELTSALLALAGADEFAKWPWIEDRHQIAAWRHFLDTHLPRGRGDFMRSRGIGAALRNGIYAPFQWPPRKDGTLSQGPPETLMTEQDLQEEFK